jgi:hypothetical protein
MRPYDIAIDIKINMLHPSTMANESFPNESTILSREDIDNFLKKLLNGDFDIKKQTCLICTKEFFPNYDDCKCDECYFAQFPKEQVKQFYRSFFD